MPEWAGSFYKAGAKADQFLAQYASVFNTVEGNTTFYNTPSPATLKKWNERTPSTFKFCFKLPRAITHIKRLAHIEGELDRFLSLFEGMRTKLGPFMIQLPEAFSPAEMYKLEKLFEILPKIYSYGIEVRHPDFYNRGKEEHAFVGLIESYGIDRMIFDTRKLHAMQSKEASIVEAQRKKPKNPVRFDLKGNRPMIRYVGSNDIINNEAYLKEWAIIVADWIREGKHPYVFIHTPDVISQPKVATHFHKLLSELIELPPLPVWPANQEQQLGLF